MIQNPIDVLSAHPIRKNKLQKQAFRKDVLNYARNLGYMAKEESGSFGVRNVVMGNPETAKYLVTAHYDTCAKMFMPNLITPRNFFAYLGYQLLIVAIIYGVLSLVGMGVWWATHNKAAAFLASYCLLWVVLVLMIAGPANKSNANDNTSGVVSVLELMRAIPREDRENICFVLFDLEEAGLRGSGAYRNAHKKQTQDQLILNFDCVGDGDELWLFPTGKLRKDQKMMEALEAICGQWGEKHLQLHSRGFSVYPSDQSNFPYGVGVAAFHRTKGGLLYVSKIHTGKDTVLEKENVTILCRQLMKFMTGTSE